MHGCRFIVGWYIRNTRREHVEHVGVSTRFSVGVIDTIFGMNRDFSISLPTLASTGVAARYFPGCSWAASFWHGIFLNHVGAPPECDSEARRVC